MTPEPRLQDWLRTVADDLELGEVELDPETVRVLLDVARDAAHGVQRLAAPLSTYLLGIAVGRGADLATAAARVAARTGSAADD